LHLGPLIIWARFDWKYLIQFAQLLSLVLIFGPLVLRHHRHHGQPNLK